MYHSVGLLLVIAHLHAVLGETEKRKNTKSREKICKQLYVVRLLNELIKIKCLKLNKNKKKGNNGKNKKRTSTLQSV